MRMALFGVKAAGLLFSHGTQQNGEIQRQTKCKRAELAGAV
jgi:hypothetical protein